MNEEPLVIFLVLVVFSLLGLFIAHAYGAFWKGRAKAFEAFAQAKGLDLTARDNHLIAKGELEGSPFTATFRLVKAGNSKIYEFKTQLPLTDCPDGLSLTNESYLSGLKRVTGAQDEQLDDDELDIAFWVQSDNLTAAKTYLNPLRRTTVLRFLTRLPGARLESSMLSCKREFLTPMFGRGYFEKMYDHHRMLADGLLGQGHEIQALGPERFTMLQRRMQRSFPGMAATLFLLFLFGGETPGLAGEIIRWAAIVGFIFAGLSLLGSMWSRLLLQGYYAFLSIAVGTYTTLFALQIIDLPVAEKDRWLTIVLGFAGAFLSWAMRHYLRGLDTSRKVRSGKKPPIDDVAL